MASQAVWRALPVGPRDRGAHRTPSTAPPRRPPRLAKATGVERHDVAVVLGSGWRPAADRFGETVAEVAATDLPGFPASTVAGHTGAVRSLRTPGRPARCWRSSAGSTPTRATTRPRSSTGCAPPTPPAATSSCSPTPPAASATDLAVGQPVLVADHLNLTGALAGGGPDRPARCRPASSTSPRRTRPACGRWPGPSTRRWPRACTPGCPARTTRRRPRSACCARSAPTWSACRRCGRRSPPATSGLEVLGLSLVTNLAAGPRARRRSTTPRSSTAGRVAAERMGDLLAAVVDRL